MRYEYSNIGYKVADLINEWVTGEQRACCRGRSSRCSRS
jgi:hypothetical protein